MRLVVYDDSRLGLLRDGTVVDVSDLVGAGASEWPPVFLLRAIAGFDRLRPRLEEALRGREGVPVWCFVSRDPLRVSPDPWRASSEHAAFKSERSERGLCPRRLPGGRFGRGAKSSSEEGLVRVNLRKP